jgi:hypothetical protein
LVDSANARPQEEALKEYDVRVLLACVLALGVSASLTSAQEPVQTRLVVGANYGAPLGLSATVGLARGRPGEGESYDIFGGLLTRVSAGQGGIKGSVGAGAVALVGPLMAGGASVNAVVMRTWGSPVGATGHGTYVGGELEFALIVRGTIGVAWRLGGDAPKDKLVTWSVGVGF